MRWHWALCVPCWRETKGMEVFESHRSLTYAVAGVLGFCLVVLMSRGHGYWNKTLYGLDFSVPAWFYAAALLIAVARDDPEEAWAGGLWDVLAPLPLDRFSSASSRSITTNPGRLFSSEPNS